MKHSVAVLDDYQGVARQYGDFARLEAAGIKIEVFQDHLTSEADLAKRLQPFTIISAMRERTPFQRSLLERLPNLKLLVTTGPVNASIDEEACKELGIAFSGTASRNPVFLRSSTCEVRDAPGRI
jgi:phosphoglycerate dehydrogenase-like enzyme